LAVIFHLGNANPTRRAGPPFSPDRTNLAFAAVGLRRDLGLSLAQYGLGSSLLFATYCLAQLPIAMLGARVGLTRTLAAACALWGVVAASMSAITTPAHFYAARLALGLAEAPTFPLIVTYLRSFHASDGAVGASYAYVHAATLVAR
jgi:MFS family permease